MLLCYMPSGLYQACKHPVLLHCCHHPNLIVVWWPAEAQRRFVETEGYEGHSSNVLRTIGYFSLVGLLRVHCLLGEYETALRALGPIQPFKTGNLLTPKVAGANIALYYYAGFSYLMLQRYLDATRSFNIVLTYINRYVWRHMHCDSQRPECFASYLMAIRSFELGLMLPALVAMPRFAQQHVQTKAPRLVMLLLSGFGLIGQCIST